MSFAPSSLYPALRPEEHIKGPVQICCISQNLAVFRRFDGKGGKLMAKKKKRKRRRSKAPRVVTNNYDRHHLLWQEKCWARGSLLELRRFHYCIILLQRDTIHKYIHLNMAGIPAPTEKNAKFVLGQLRILENYGAISDDDPIEKRLVVLASLFDCFEQPTADAIRRQLQIVYRFKNEPP